MKNALNNTGYLLVKAGTNSAWDNCVFAIVCLTENWKKEQAKRLEAAKLFAEDYTFHSLNYFDTAVDFYTSAGDNEPDIKAMLGKKEWVFVELGDNEWDAFPVPENALDCYELVVYSNGNARYKAYGKHTGEEFWTEEFSLTQLI
ncbi:MAG: hypothetical protein ACTHLE_01315 [Agriterribacter sp.]